MKKLKLFIPFYGIYYASYLNDHESDYLYKIANSYFISCMFQGIYIAGSITLIVNYLP